MTDPQKSLWQYREEAELGPDSRDVLIGFAVEATDGHIGKVDALTADSDRHSIVVDTGFWIFGKKRRIPAGMIARVDRFEEMIFLRINKDSVKAAPEYDVEADRIEAYDQYYRPLV